MIYKMNKPNLNIKGHVQDLTKVERNDKINKSTFLLTINLNQRYNNDDPHLQNDISIFEEEINNILNSIDQYITLKPGDNWTDEKIQNCNIDYTIEKGLKKNCLHCHILLSFDHKTSVKLNYDKIKTQLKTQLGLPNIYVFNKVIKNSDNHNILEYLDKYV